MTPRLLTAAAAALLLGVVQGGAGHPAVDKVVAVIGGERGSITRVPWQVSLQWGGYHICGGAIISRHWVLTAAHCTVGTKPHQLQLRVGSDSNAEGGAVYKITKVIDHGKYGKKTYENDISALKTTMPIKFGPTVSAVALPKVGAKRPPVGTNLIVSGFGKMRSRYSQFLRVANIKLVNYNKCRNYFSGKHVKSQLCAGSRKKKICDGDSGGPLVKGKVLVGLVSYSDNSCKSPGDGYTDVAYYRNWIKKHTGI